MDKMSKYFVFLKFCTSHAQEFYRKIQAVNIIIKKVFKNKRGGKTLSH